MKARGKPRTRSTMSTRAPYHPPAEALLEQRDMIRATVRACSVPAEEIEDVTSDCIEAAWCAIQRGEFRLSPDREPTKALEAWLRGIAWRLSSHERVRARHRREVLCGDPWSIAPGPHEVVTEGQIAARLELRALAALPQGSRDLLLAVAAGEETGEIARSEGVSERAILFRVERARAKLDAGESQRRGRRREIRPRGKGQAVTVLSGQKVYAALWSWLGALDVPLRDRRDVAQDVLLAAFTSLHTYDPMKSRPERWLNGIAVHVAAHYHEKAHRRREELSPEPLLDAEDPAPLACERIDAEQNRQRALAELHSLDPDLRAVLVAHDIDQVPMTEIAAKHGIPVSTAYKRRARALRALGMRTMVMCGGQFDSGDPQ